MNPHALPPVQPDMPATVDDARSEHDSGAVTPSRAARSGRAARNLAGAVVSVLLLYLMFRQVDWAAFSAQIGAIDAVAVVTALALLVVVYLLKLLRWHRMLKLAGAHASPAVCARPFFIGFALNNLLPLRAGDVARALAFRETIGLARGAIVATLIVERLLDLMVLLAIFTLALVWLPRWQAAVPWADAMRWGALGVFLGLLGATWLLFFSPRLHAIIGRLAERLPARACDRLMAALGSIQDAGRLLGTWRVLLATSSLTALAWALEGGVFILSAHALGLDSAGAWLAMTAGNLGTLLPGAPGHLGTFDYFTMQGMVAHGVAHAPAAAFAILVHMILWLPVTLIGLLYLAGGRGVSPLRPA